MPLARGAWARHAVPAVAIINAIPRFGECEPITLRHLDPFGLFVDDDDDDDCDPYDPRVLEAMNGAAIEHN